MIDWKCVCDILFVTWAYELLVKLAPNARAAELWDQMS